MFQNPILRMDYPDPDVIRVEDTYYMISTTMHFMPGAEILRSYDLQHWEHATYVFDTLDHTDAQCLKNGKNIYGKGMWAASLRYHNHMFYVVFVANDTQKTYLYRSESIEGPWKKSYIDGFYHDPSLFFDDDDRCYLIYGNRKVYLTELNEELTAPKENGLHRLLVEDTGEASLGYEGSHFYKIDGYYYLFLIHSPKKEWYRTQACFSSQSLTEEFKGGEIFHDDAGHRNSGIAQGGIVNTPDGDWYGILFQDRGASGRIPYVIPITLQNGEVTMGKEGKLPTDWDVRSLRPDYTYKSMIVSGFKNEKGDCLHSAWQWNHEPELAGWWLDEKKDAIWLKTVRLSNDVTDTPNVLTQRMMEPGCLAEVTVSVTEMKVGDMAGLTAFQGCFGLVGIKKEENGYFLVMSGKSIHEEEDALPVEYEKVAIGHDLKEIRLCAKAEFSNEDAVTFLYQKDGAWKEIGIRHLLAFRLDHFCGCRFGVFYYATKEIGGQVQFSDFQYTVE